MVERVQGEAKMSSSNLFHTMQGRMNRCGHQKDEILYTEDDKDTPSLSINTKGMRYKIDLCEVHCGVVEFIRSVFLECNALLIGSSLNIVHKIYA